MIRDLSSTPGDIAVFVAKASAAQKKFLDSLTTVVFTGRIALDYLQLSEAVSGL